MNARKILQHSFWLADKPQYIDVSSLLTAGATHYAVSLKAEGRGAIDAVFAFDGRWDRSDGRNPQLVFSWTHTKGATLPSMRGSVVLRRIGTFASLFVRAEYAYDDGPAGRLFHEAIGERLAGKTFEALVSAIRLSIMQGADRRRAA